jgi:hypothetical protein
MVNFLISGVAYHFQLYNFVQIIDCALGRRLINMRLGYGLLLPLNNHMVIHCASCTTQFANRILNQPAIAFSIQFQTPLTDYCFLPGHKGLLLIFTWHLNSNHFDNKNLQYLHGDTPNQELAQFTCLR